MNVATLGLDAPSSAKDGQRTALALPVLNLDQATFECTFGRGCEGICCKEGRPPVYADEVENIAAHLDKFLPHMRPEASAVAQTEGLLTPRQRRFGAPLLRVVQGWCIFFNQGCVLHKVGADEGDKNRYKPADCALFPLQQDGTDQWYVRQSGYKRERWDLFCLNPSNSAVPAHESLRDELALAQQHDEKQKAMAARPNEAAEC